SRSAVESGAIAVFLADGEAVAQGLHAAGAGRMGKRCGGDADGRVETLCEVPTFVQAHENARAKSVTRSRRAGDEFVGQFDGRLPDIFALARASETAFGEVNDDKFAHAGLEERARGVANGDGVECAVGLSDLEASRFAGLDFVQDAIIN